MKYIEKQKINDEKFDENSDCNFKVQNCINKKKID
jgi:hypothetical protein